MEKKTKTVKVTIALEYEPVWVATMVCPNCNLSQQAILQYNESDRTFLHSCDVCDEDFYIEIPNFPPIKKSKKCL